MSTVCTVHGILQQTVRQKLQVIFVYLSVCCIFFP